MTPEQLLHLGSRQVAYLRSSMCDGEVALCSLVPTERL